MRPFHQPSSIVTPAKHWQQALAANSEANSHASTAPATALTNGSGVFSAQGANALVVMPYGAANQNLTFDLRLLIASPLVDGQGDDAVEEWFFNPVCTIACTTGNVTGNANGVIGSGNYLCDTLSKTDGIKAIDVPSFPADTPAFFVVDLYGPVRFKFDFKIGTAASANALFRCI